MSGGIWIDRRFRGPPDSGNGGYTCGVVAGEIDGPAEVTLRLPPPLETQLRVERTRDGGVRVLDGDALVAEGAGRNEDLGIRVPEPVGIDEAEAAGERAWFTLHPEEHPFPTCFVCGPRRERGDGLRILVGPLEGRPASADGWTPAQDLAGPDGIVRPQFVWAALDCSSGIGSFGEDLGGDNPFVLGRLAVSIRGPVRAGEPHAVLGWRVGRDGRKLAAGSAIYSADGELVGLARATWIQLAA
jgi:hypothetical protein